jgi:PAS domain S-box-containing protein
MSRRARQHRIHTGPGVAPRESSSGRARRRLVPRAAARTPRRRTEELFRLLAEHARDVIFRYRLQPDAALEYISPAVTTLTGYAPEVFYADPTLPAKLVHPDDRHLYEALARRSWKNGGLPVTLRWLRRDGAVVWTEHRYTGVYDASRSLVAVEGIARDITARRLAEEALRASEERYRNIYTTAPLAFVLWDREMRITDWNQRAEELFGWSREEVLGRRFFDFLIPAGERAGVSAALGDLLRTQQPSHSVNLNCTKDGRVIACDWNNSPLHDQAGQVVGAMSLALDITERQRAEQGLRRSLRALKTLSQGSQALMRTTTEAELLDEVCRIIVESGGYRFAWVGFAEANGARRVRPVAWAGAEAGYLGAVTVSWGEESWGCGPVGTAIRTGTRRVVRDVSTDASFLPWRAEALSRGLASVLGLPLLDSGRCFGALAIYAGEVDAFDDEEVQLLTELAEDLAYGVVARRTRVERERAEAEVHRLNTELEGRVHERTLALEVANRELEAFSYSVSHDLRAPLRAIEGFSCALLAEHAGRLDAQGQLYLRRVCAAADRMGQLIDDLLCLARVTQHEMRWQAVDLSALAHAIAAELQKTQPERCVQFVIAPGLVVQGDKRLLRVALENLLGNAWKYTSHHPQARIELGELGGDDRVYCVRDDGAGFDMAYADKLFGPFQRLHGSDFEGTGIGLATVQRIIRRHGGRIWAEGAVERGACVSFTLGCPPAAASSA